MRTVAAACACLTLSTALAAQAPAPPPQTDRTKATHFPAADLQAALAKLPGDRPASSVRVFSLAPYNVNVERRLPKPQGASMHEAQAELFYVIEGSGTMVTGGTIPGATRNGTNLAGKAIEGGTRIAFKAGDFIMVPSGVAHQFVDLTTPVHVMSMYLPEAK
jgi:mannose-6-phosphate isomerase-like protein (cupin superfamily)